MSKLSKRWYQIEVFFCDGKILLVKAGCSQWLNSLWGEPGISTEPDPSTNWNYSTMRKHWSEAGTRTNWLPQFDKNDLHRLVCRCSCCTKTDTNTDFYWVLYPFYWYLCRIRSWCRQYEWTIVFGSPVYRVLPVKTLRLWQLFTRTINVTVFASGTFDLFDGHWCAKLRCNPLCPSKWLPQLTPC